MMSLVLERLLFTLKHTEDTDLILKDISSRLEVFFKICGMDLQLLNRKCTYIVC